MNNKQNVKKTKKQSSLYITHLVFHAFTLAEVLITLGIIGVVAALTIPTLINNSQKSQYISALEKTYSTLSQNFLLIQNDNGGDVSSIFVSTNSNTNMLNAFATQLKVVKTCTGAGGNCWYTTPLYELSPNYLTGIWTSNPDSLSTVAKAQLADGSLMMFLSYLNSCTSDKSTLNDGNPLDGSVCGEIYVDINGFKGPNKWGRDVFGFWMAKKGIYPWGMIYDTSIPMASWCGDATSSTTTGYGIGCAAKVITENAMNY